MPNFASVLKEEIIRLARKEIRQELERLKKASSQYRTEITALKRQVASLEKQVARLEKAVTKSAPSGGAEAKDRIRFSAKGLAAHRARLGLSAQDAGLLLGVSAQTVYNWEAGKTRPREGQLPAIAALRAMGKRAALAQIAQGSEQPPAQD